MISEFQQHIDNHFPFLKGKKLLLAVSGGVDSMVLCDLIQKTGHEFGIAHCNFQLRGTESDEDQVFLEQYANQNNIPLFATRFDTMAFAEDYKLSIQVAARELRYRWFYELLEIQNFDYILTAHHADDNLETFLINLSRGTGLEGFTGIPSQNNSIIRPLLVFSREDIVKHALAHTLEWREDSSNASDKYLRNQIRHQIVPVMKSLNNNFLESFEQTLEYLKQSQSLVDDASRIVYRKVVSDEADLKKIDLKELLQLENYRAYLYQWLKPLGFTAWKDIYELVHSHPGKQILSENFRLLKDRDFLIIAPKHEGADEIHLIPRDTLKVNLPLKMSLDKVEAIGDVSNKTIFVDDNKLVYPLLIKRWEEGDVFYPLGMQGRSKKLSKLFKDEKLSLIDKENVWVLWSDQQIVWIIGIRPDERFKIEPTTTNILKIALLQ